MLSALLITAALATTPAAEVELLSNVQRAYKQAGNFEASFVQIFIGRIGRKREESGLLWATGDGRVRWEYRTPERKYFIYDGKTAYFYEPKESQVIRFDDFNDSPLSTALRFLLGRGNYAESFDIKACEKWCDSGAKGDTVIALYPKEPLGTVDHILLFIDVQAKQVRMSVLVDTQKNRTEYRFDDVRFGTPISDEKFIWKKPAGVEELNWAEARKRQAG